MQVQVDEMSSCQIVQKLLPGKSKTMFVDWGIIVSCLAVTYYDCTAILLGWQSLQTVRFYLEFFTTLFTITANI